MKTINQKIVIIVSALSVILSMFVLYTPMIKKDLSGYSAVKVTEHIKEISREPHSVFEPEEHEKVRQYLKETTTNYVNEPVQEFHYSAETVGESYPIDNLLVKIQGASDAGILLVAHYDSRGHAGRYGELGRSYGAADDGYGLGVLLEVARLYGKRTDLKNSIYLLFTDGEETGLYGAKFAAKEAFMEQVRFVINVEARGVKGAAYMFETSKNNSKVIQMYQHANLPVTYSLATAVYTVMPNYTDFSEFLEIGKPGLNFAVLDNLYYYHTPLDNYTNINLSSIQHYGEQIIPIVEEFVSHEKYQAEGYFNSKSNHIFFTLLPNVFISYRDITGTVLTCITMLAFIGLVVIYVRKNLLTLKQLGRGALIVLGSLICGAILGFLVSRTVAFLSKVPWSISYVRTDIGGIPSLLTMLGGFLGMLYLLQKYNKNTVQKNGILFAGIAINLFLAFVTGIVLSGASFLFFVPSFIATITLYLLLWKENKMTKHIILSQTIIWNTILILPILYSLYLALTVGGLPAFMIIMVLYAAIMLPSISKQIQE